MTKKNQAHQDSQRNVYYFVQFIQQLDDEQFSIFGIATSVADAEKQAADAGMHVCRIESFIVDCITITNTDPNNVRISFLVYPTPFPPIKVVASFTMVNNRLSFLINWLGPTTPAIREISITFARYLSIGGTIK